LDSENRVALVLCKFGCEDERGKESVAQAEAQGEAEEVGLAAWTSEQNPAAIAAMPGNIAVEVAAAAVVVVI
jgi:hypothetical protein